MKIPVNVVVTCTNRKRHEAPAELQLRSVPGASVTERARAWTSRIRSTPAKRVPAGDLYCGEHWSVVRALPEQAARHGYDIRVWVASAGYGLISLTDEIAPYQATLTVGQADSVVRAGESPEDWWSEVSANGRVARSLAALAAQASGSPMLVAVSPPYLRAMARDLTAAADHLDSPGLLSVVCAGNANIAAVNAFRVPCDARLQHAAGGGTRVSLNVRLAGLALDQLAGELPTYERISSAFSRLLASAAPVSVYDRAKLDDEGVRAFIREAIREEPSVSKTGLLRRLREAGQACEQGRFGHLFRQVKEAGHGH